MLVVVKLDRTALVAIDVCYEEVDHDERKYRCQQINAKVMIALHLRDFLEGKNSAYDEQAELEWA